jgi:hypothetical protein
MSWLSPFKYRRKITVTAGSNGMPANYQLLLKIPYLSGKMNPDGSDIRVTKADGVTQLSIFIDLVTSSYVCVWVKDPDSLSANESHDLYVYYGNPYAQSVSNGESVFDFFDHFLGTSLDLNKWTPACQESGYPQVSNSEVTLSAYGIPGWGRGGIFKNVDPTYPSRWIGRGQWLNVQRMTCGLATVGQADGTIVDLFFDGATLEIAINCSIPYAFSYNTLQQYYKWYLGFRSSNIVDCRFYTDDWSEIWSVLGISYSQYTGNKFFLGMGWDNGQRGKWDWGAQAKYVYPEPSLTVGSEETLPLGFTYRAEWIDFHEIK